MNYSEKNAEGRRWNGRVGAVGVLMEGDRFLVIRRSPKVRAPNMVCFPGGSVEESEFADDAVRREMGEELAIDVRILSHLWTSQTAWGTRLEWFQIARESLTQQPVPFEDEVAECFWLTETEILARDDLLGSMPTFFEAVHDGLFQLLANDTQSS